MGRIYAFLIVAALAGCDPNGTPYPDIIPDGERDSEVIEIALEDGVAFQEADGSWGFAGMAEPNPPTEFVALREQG